MANTGLAKVAGSCFADTFVVNQSLVLRINICGISRHLRQARNRNADDAEDYFKKAKNEFDYAYSKLNSSTYQDNIDYLNNYLRNAKSYVVDGIQYLKKGVDELEDTLDELKKCN